MIGVSPSPIRTNSSSSLRKQVAAIRRGVHSSLLPGVVAACLRAGAEIQRHVALGFETFTKGDESPVTAADHAAEAVLLDALGGLDPDTPIVAEEEVAAGRIPKVGRRFWLVDPLDGTRDFVRGGHDYTVNAGLVVDGAPVLGVVYAPALGRLFFGATGREVGAGAWLAEGRGTPGAVGEARPIRVRQAGAWLTVTASKSHGTSSLDRYLATLPVGERLNTGSSLKFGLVAAGEADVYPRTGPTMEWDTAAGHAVLLAAGGLMLAPDGSPFAYGKPGFLNGAFVATGGWEPPPIGPYA